MPTKFVYDAGELQGNTFIHPFIEKPRSQVASAVAEAGVGAFTAVKAGQLQEDLEAQVESFIGEEAATRGMAASQLAGMLESQTEGMLTDEVDTITTAEAKLVDDAQRQATKLHKAFVQGRISSDAFRANVEKTMKSYIQRTPGLSSEFRKVAQDTLGFDPTGSRLRAAMDASSLAAKGGEAQLKSMNAKLIEAGLADNKLTAAENVEAFWPMYSKQRSQVWTATTGLDLLKKQHEVTAITENDLATDTAPAKLLESLTETKAALGLPEITVATINSLTSEQKLESINKVSNLKALFIASMRDNFGQIPDKVDGIFRGSLDFYDNTIALLQGKQTAELYANDYSTNINMAKADIAQTPENANMIALASFFPRDAAPPSVTIAFSKWFQGIVGAGASAKEGIDPNSYINNLPIPTPEKEKLQIHLEDQIKGAWEASKLNLTDPAKQQIGDMIVAYTNNLYSAPEKVRTRTMDNLYAMAKDPEFSKFMTQTPNGEAVKRNLSEANGVYLPRVFAALDAELDSDITNKGFYSLGIKDGVVSFQLTEAAPAAGRVGGATTRKVRDLNDTYSIRLNNIIRSHAHLSGHTNYNAAAIELLGRDLLTRIDTVVMDEELLKTLQPAQ